MDSGGGTASAGSSKAYIPQAQPQADQGYQDLVRQMFSQGVGGLNAVGDVSPSGQAWPYVQSAFYNEINNPYQNQAIQGGVDASQYFANAVLPNVNQGAQQLAGLGNMAAIAAQNPAYGQAGSVGYNMSGPFQGATRQLLGDIFNPSYQSAIAAGNQAAQRQFGAGDAIRTAAFDPQQALYNRTQAQLADQVGAGLANSGLAGTPYAQSVRGNTLGNFNIDWQNNLLQRMLQGGQTAGALDTAGLNAMLNPSLSASSAAQGDLGAAQGGLSAALQGLLTPANQQIGALVNATNAAQGGFGGANTLLGQGAQGYNTFAGMPYGNYNTVQGNNFGAAQNLIALGNQNYTVPQQTLANLKSYLGLGQDASQLANSIGTTNFNQIGQGIQGGIGALSGINSLTGGGITSGLGNLFGSGAAGATAAGTGGLYGTGLAASTAPFDAAFLGGDAVAAGGGGALDFLAPAALSA